MGISSLVDEGMLRTLAKVGNDLPNTLITVGGKVVGETFIMDKDFKKNWNSHMRGLTTIVSSK